MIFPNSSYNCKLASALRRGKRFFLDDSASFVLAHEVTAAGRVLATAAVAIFAASEDVGWAVGWCRGNDDRHVAKKAASWHTHDRIAQTLELDSVSARAVLRPLRNTQAFYSFVVFHRASRRAISATAGGSHSVSGGAATGGGGAASPLCDGKAVGHRKTGRAEPMTPIPVGR